MSHFSVLSLSKPTLQPYRLIQRSVSNLRQVKLERIPGDFAETIKKDVLHFLWVG
jgi:hypothetical protein